MNSKQTEERMSQTDQEQDYEETSGDVAKLVPVTESIRYRRRAQSAEKQAQDLTDQLTQANERLAEMSEDMDRLQLDQKLTRKLTAAGVIDLEAAVLIARTRMEGKNADGDIENCIEQLQSEKQYLFRRSAEAATSRRTAGAKDRVTQNRTVLQQAATKAARTGQRADLQQYLKLRRNLL